MLKRLGWDTEDMTQIYPQKSLANGGRVDYDLQTGGSSRVFIEAKRWSHTLNEEDEKQLTDYCLASKPDLAVLTNGRHWRLYLPPLKPRRKADEPKLRQFLAFGISEQPREVEKNFRQFLAHDSMLSGSAVKKTVDEARALWNEHQAATAVKRGLEDALDELSGNPELLTEFLTEFAKSKGIQPSEALVKEALSGVDVIKKPSENKTKLLKPSSFTLRPMGEQPIVRPVKKRWKEVLLGVCAVMLERHPETFEGTVLGMPNSFSKSQGKLGWDEEIGNTGIYVKKGDGYYTKKICLEILDVFGYPADSLFIEEK